MIALVVTALVCRRAVTWYWYTRGVVPLTNLPVARLPEAEARQIEGTRDCETAAGFHVSFSPDGRFYVRFPLVTIRILGVEAYRRNMELYEAETGRRLGFYQFRQLRFCGWSEDSAGVYLSDGYPGEARLTILATGPSRRYVGPLKKVLVPCRGPLTGVSLLPRLYWEMRCVFPDPFQPVAVWLPLGVLAIGLGGVGWAGYRAWRHPQVVRLRQRARELVWG